MSNIFNCLFSILVFCSLLIAPQTTVFAAQSSTQTVFKQQILPVRFVYVDKQGNIDRIWNNAQEGDSMYVIKFFETGTNTEISQNKNLILQYVRLISKVSIFSQGNIFIAGLEIATIPTKINTIISFQDSLQGLQEIHTYI